MRTQPLLILSAIWLLSLTAPADASQPGGESLESPGGVVLKGRLVPSSGVGFPFEASGRKDLTKLAAGMTIQGPGVPPPAAAGTPPFLLDLGHAQQIAGRFVSLGKAEVEFIDNASGRRIAADRAGTSALVQRPGENLAFQEGFEELSTERWMVKGQPEVVDSPRIAGERSLRIPAGGASLTHRLDPPIGVGRLEAAFHDDLRTAAGHRLSLDLTFRGPTGPETIRVILGWEEDSLAVISTGGPALAVQRLARSQGWHRLAVRFGADDIEFSVDKNELAHGKGLAGPLVEIRLSTDAGPGAVGPVEDLAGHLDDLRLVRVSDSIPGLEIDVTQDDVRMVGGDQVFGSVQTADRDGIKMLVDGRPAAIPWGEVSGIHFRRFAHPGAPVEGLLVMAAWRSGPAELDPQTRNSVEGALARVTDDSLTIATPYLGKVVVPRERLIELRVLGQGRRIVMDPTAHHLGDEISVMPPLLDPPQPEGGVLESSLELPSVPEAPVFLVLDVVQVVGENAEVPTFSDMVKRGELRTILKVNGEPFDYLNRHVTSRNDAPERIRIPVPKELLRPGQNRFRLEQVGTANNPNYLDDLGILGIAVEYAPTGEHEPPAADSP